MKGGEKMKELEWIFEKFEAEAIPPVNCCSCTTFGVDIGNDICRYLTDYLIVVTPPGGCGN